MLGQPYVEFADRPLQLLIPGSKTQSKNQINVRSLKPIETLQKNLNSERGKAMATSQIPPEIQASVDGTKVEYVRLGKSGLHVSVPILGAMSFGDPGWNSWVLDEEKVGRRTTLPSMSRKSSYQ
jgi:hypothetical protein